MLKAPGTHFRAWLVAECRVLATATVLQQLLQPGWYTVVFHGTK